MQHGKLSTNIFLKDGDSKKLLSSASQLRSFHSEKKKVNFRSPSPVKNWISSCSLNRKHTFFYGHLWCYRKEVPRCGSKNNFYTTSLQKMWKFRASDVFKTIIFHICLSDDFRFNPGFVDNELVILIQRKL